MFHEGYSAGGQAYQTAFPGVGLRGVGKVLDKHVDNGLHSVPVRLAVCEFGVCIR